MTLNSGDNVEKSGTGIIAIDIGTTTMKACLYDSRCRLVNHSKESVRESCIFFEVQKFCLI